MRFYGQYCPVAKGAELIGDRWTLLIIRELLFGRIRFGELERALPGISKSVLAERLRRLQSSGIIRQSELGYSLTPAGEELRPVVKSIGDWVARWVMDEPSRAELDPELLMLWISRHVRIEALPQKRTVIEFRFLDLHSRRIWLLLDRQDASICLTYPGFEPDVYLSSRTRTLYRVYMGRTTLADAVREGEVTLEGTPALVRAFPSWMTWSQYAPTMRAKLSLPAMA